MGKVIHPGTGEILESDESFSTWLAEHGNGLIDGELTDAMRRLIAAATSIDKVAVLTIKVKIKPEGGGVVISVEQFLTEPTQPPVAKFYFQGEDGMPTRRDPRQPSLGPDAGGFVDDDPES